ncbi:MAG: hypothetical protein GXP16_09065 [Gammaproteobacteria bacterium]|nr:hypothetical protein [Gammaproteobacteria bacterium]
MAHHLATTIQYGEITHASPDQVAQVCDELLEELDQCRNGNYPGGIEERLDRLELVVLTLATSAATKLRG